MAGLMDVIVGFEVDATEERMLKVLKDAGVPESEHAMVIRRYLAGWFTAQSNKKLGLVPSPPPSMDGFEAWAKRAAGQLREMES